MYTGVDLQQAIIDFGNQILNDPDIVKQNFSHIHKMKKEFGNGYALINLGYLNPESGEFTLPAKKGLETFWLDRESTGKFFKGELASKVLESINFDDCPPNHEIFVLSGSLDRGAEFKDERHLTAVQSTFVKDPFKIKPSSITEKQIEKRLRRMHSQGIRLLVLDTSNPDYMGKNLAKWLRVLKRLSQQGDKHFNIMVNSSKEYPSEIPQDLKDYSCTINFT